MDLGPVQTIHTYIHTYIGYTPTVVDLPESLWIWDQHWPALTTHTYIGYTPTAVDLPESLWIWDQYRVVVGFFT